MKQINKFEIKHKLRPEFRKKEGGKKLLKVQYSKFFHYSLKENHFCENSENYLTIKKVANILNCLH